jgi:hypothetical protein
MGLYFESAVLFPKNYPTLMEMYTFAVQFAQEKKCSMPIQSEPCSFTLHASLC